jgi:hypothetical protein
MDREEHKNRVITRRLNQELPWGIEQEGTEFYHPELGLIISFEGELFHESLHGTQAGKFEARKLFIGWWVQRKNFLEQFKMEPKGSQLLLMDKLGENKTEEMLGALISRLEAIKDQKSDG